LLQALYDERALTRSQIVALGFFGSNQRANARLKRLLDHGLVRRLSIGRGVGCESIYGIGPRATALLAAGGIDLAEVRNISRRRSGPTFLEHGLACVDFRIALELDLRAAGGELTLWLPESRCAHVYSVLSTKGQWVRRAVKPDAFARIALGETTHDLFVEIDRGNVAPAKFAAKAAAYVRYAVEAFRSVYKTESFTVATVTTDEARLRRLASACADAQPQRFIFTTFDLIRVQGCLGPVWVTAAESTGHDLSDPLTTTLEERA
jgi:hypothetical protein